MYQKGRGCTAIAGILLAGVKLGDYAYRKHMFQGRDSPALGSRLGIGIKSGYLRPFDSESVQILPESVRIVGAGFSSS
jgi:hypothetical protein